MAIVGPGADPQRVTDVKPLLEGASEYEYVTLLNPLTDDFAIRVAQDVPVNMPTEIRAKTGLVQDDKDVTRNYGIDLKNPDFQGRRHIINDTVIKAGKTINLKGSEAQVAIRQIVNEVMQREDNKRMMADPHARQLVEERIIVSRGSIQDLMDGGLRSQRTQIDEAIDNSNKESHETEFPGLAKTSGSPEADTLNAQDGDGSSKKAKGKDQTANG